MHRTAFAFAIAGALAEYLRHHLVQPPTLGDQMTMAAMGRRDAIGLAQRGAHARRRRFLSNRHVDESRNLARQREVARLGFEMPNLLHRVIHLEQLVFGDIHEGPCLLWVTVIARNARPRRRKTTIPNRVNPSNEFAGDDATGVRYFAATPRRKTSTARRICLEWVRFGSNGSGSRAGGIKPNRVASLIEPVVISRNCSAASFGSPTFNLPCWSSSRR